MSARSLDTQKRRQPRRISQQPRGKGRQPQTTATYFSSRKGGYFLLKRGRKIAVPKEYKRHFVHQQEFTIVLFGEGGIDIKSTIAELQQHAQKCG